MRKILCPECAKSHEGPLHPEDKAIGWKRRLVPLLAKKPADHAIFVNGVKQPQLASILCDNCGEAIADGSPAVAVSMWLGQEMDAWEHEYGQVTTQ